MSLSERHSLANERRKCYCHSRGQTLLHVTVQTADGKRHSRRPATAKTEPLYLSDNADFTAQSEINRKVLGRTLLVG
jgi:hypothetical protein